MATLPFSYFKTLRPFRSADCIAIGTGLSAEVFGHVCKYRSARNRFIAEKTASHAGSCISRRFTIRRLKPLSTYVANRDKAKAVDDFGCLFVQKIFARVGNLGVDLAAFVERILARCAAPSSIS